MRNSASELPRHNSLQPPSEGHRWVVVVSLTAAVLSLLPYLYDRTFQGISAPYGWYSWFAYNVSDGCVYLSWMRQYADGAWTHRNLFTTLPQSGHQVNLLFLLLGKLSAISGLHPLALYHIARCAAALVVPVLFWRLTGALEIGDRARKAALLIGTFGSGVGWLPGIWERGFAGPVDVWQPEAVTFLSLFLFPLFGVSMALMLAVLIHLIEAEKRRSLRHALQAGMWGFVLANVHTYDVIPLAIIWIAILLVAGVCRLCGTRIEWPRWERGTVIRLFASAVPTAISFGYMVWILRTEQVFAARVATETLSPALCWVLLGFGLSVPLAALGAVHGWSRGASTAVAFLCLWAFLHVAASYLPVPFQRKMLMGAQWPVAILAGLGLSMLLRRASPRTYPAFLMAAMVPLALTNIRFIVRDRGSVRYGGDTVRAFLFAGEVRALNWLREHARAGALQPLPWIAVGEDGRVGFADTTLACFAPGLSGRPVHAGHWGETPQYGRTMGEWVRFLLPDTPDGWRRSLLKRSGVRYLLFGQKRSETRDFRAESLLRSSSFPSGMPYLRRVEDASNEDVDVFEVLDP